MLILPQILYLFRTLPIHIPHHYINSIATLGWRYIWNGKKSRWSRNNLTFHRKAGGVELVDIFDYYWAVHLDQIKHWFQKTDTPLWVDIETTLAPTNNLTLLTLSDRWTPWDTKQMSPPMQASLRAWRFLLEHNHRDTHDTKYDLPLTLLDSMIPMMNVKDLMHKGITHISDLYTGPQHKSVEHIITQ